jgi:hypothetical protein
VHHADLQLAQGQDVALRHQPVEGAPVGNHVLGVEHGAEGLLDPADIRPDHHLGARAASDQIGRRQVVSMEVGLKDPGQAEAAGLDLGQQGVG